MHIIYPYGIYFKALNVTDEQIEKVEQELIEMINQIKGDK